MSDILEAMSQQTATEDVATQDVPVVVDATIESPSVNITNVETATTTETSPSNVVETPTPETPKFYLDSYLKEMGLSKSDLDSLKESKIKEKEEAEKPLNEQKAWANVIADGIQDGILTKEDVVKYESISKREDNDLVFENFKKDFKPSDDTLSAEEIEEEMQEAYRNEYPSQKLVKLEAEKIREEIAKPFKSAETNLTKKQSVLGLKKMHEELLDTMLNSKHQESYKVGDKDIVVEVDNPITKEEVNEALTKTEGGKQLLNIMHSLYNESKEQSAELYKSFVSSLAKEKAQSKIIENVWEQASEHFKSVYSVGAQAPFTSQKINVTEQSGDGMKDLFNKRNN